MQDILEKISEIIYKYKNNNMYVHIKIFIFGISFINLANTV